MVENTNLVLNHPETPLDGDVVIAPEVLEVIIGIAASKVEGVYAMRGTAAQSMAQLLGVASSHGKGVSLKIENGSLIVDIYCYLAYGISVPKVALDMQEKVKQQVLFMANIELSEVNVHIVGVVPEKVAKPDFNELFDSEEGV